ncbi:MAG: CPBP family intramembrane metalloprotease [Clostridiales bacterium]|nr:CPBP family intramembrane metalloprotease [Clostridiales bacterium]
MEKITNQQRLRPWMGFVLFAVLMAYFLTVCVWLQGKFGIPGLIMTEVSFLAIALFYCLICRVKIKEVFPIKLPKIRDLFGALCIYLGAFGLSLVATGIAGMILPSANEEVSALNNTLYGSMSFPVTLLVVAVTPAICEEAIHRGAILSNFRSIKKDWIIVLIMALMFGVNHVSFLRFGATAILGAALSYVVVKKNNMLLSMLMHFVNNSISCLAGFYSSKSNVDAGANLDFKQALGAYLILGFAAPVLIVLGTMLLDRKNHKPIRFLFAGILSLVMFLSGIGMTIFNTLKAPIMNTTISYEVTEEDKESSMLDFTIEEDRRATVVVVVSGAKGDYKVRIDGDSGSNIINADIPQGKIRTITYQVDLKKDHYTITIESGDNAIGEKPIFQVAIN